MAVGTNISPLHFESNISPLHLESLLPKVGLFICTCDLTVGAVSVVLAVRDEQEVFGEYVLHQRNSADTCKHSKKYGLWSLKRL